jgi:hypothetical protein
MGEGCKVYGSQTGVTAAFPNVPMPDTSLCRCWVTSGGLEPVRRVRFTSNRDQIDARNKRRFGPVSASCTAKS